MVLTCFCQVQSCQRAYQLLRGKLDFPSEDIIFDCLLTPVGSEVRASVKDGGSDSDQWRWQIYWQRKLLNFDVYPFRQKWSSFYILIVAEFLQAIELVYLTTLFLNDCWPENSASCRTSLTLWPKWREPALASVSPREWAIWATGLEQQLGALQLVPRSLRMLRYAESHQSYSS